MRILSITAGAGGMYCGSCLRDNDLAAELQRLGHDVSLLPLYTPTRTDQANVSQPRVFFGGISVYLQQQLAVFRHTPRLLDRLWDSPGVIRTLAGRAVDTDPKRLGGLTVSVLRGEQGFQRKEVRKLMDWLRTQPEFDLVNLPNALLLGLAKPLKEGLGRPVCCTLQGEDLFLEGLPRADREQALALIRTHAACVDAFLAVSDYYADFMAGYLGLPRQAIHTVPLGVRVPVGERPPRDPATPFTIGYLARLAPEKGLHLLCQAYRLLRQERGLPQSRLEVAGYVGPAQAGYLEGIRRELRASGLEAEFRYWGALDYEGKARFLRGLDVMSVPSPYREPKGLYVLEALACGVPVVQPRHGAFPEVLARTGGGVLFEPGDAGGLADGILSLQRDRTLARDLGLRGAEGVRNHYGVERMAERALQVYQRLVTTAGGRVRVRTPPSDSVRAGTAPLAGAPSGGCAWQPGPAAELPGLVVDGLGKHYLTPRGSLPILDGISFSLDRGEAMAIMGPSGSGKSTLLYLLGTLEPASAGRVRLDGVDPSRLPEKELAAFRNRHIGFVFQDHCLLPQCSVLENVLVPTLVAETRNDHLGRARELLEMVGLSDRAEHRPAELSGGEKQRVALARALILEPTLVLCDEPTGNLDHGAAETVARLLLDLHRLQQTILVVVTHNPQLAARFPVQRRLVEGRLQAG